MSDDAVVQVVLHPRVGGSGHLRLWLGVLRCRSDVDSMALRWSLDDQTIDHASPTVRVLRPLERTFDEVSEHFVSTITAVYEIDCAPGRHRVCVRLDCDGVEVGCAELLTATCPDSLPDDYRASFNVLIASCFSQRDDRIGNIAAASNLLPVELRPHLTLLVGDQVYLDSPFHEHFPDGAADVNRRLETKYLLNFSLASPELHGFSQLLDLAPAASVPDDHEYWNNYPMPPKWPMWLRHGGAAHWESVSRRLYESFQMDKAGEFERTIDISPLSFYLMDNRTFRSRDMSSSLQQTDAGPVGIYRFRLWLQHVLSSDHLFPILVTGPSVVQPVKYEKRWDPRSTKPDGGYGDANLANFDDYRDIMSGLRELMRQGRPVLSVSGDVHYARFLRATTGLDAPGELAEIISSPTSLIWQPLKRHVGQATLPDRTMRVPGATLNIVPTFPTEHEDPEVGDNFAIASFRRSGTGVDMTLRYLILPKNRQATMSRPISWQLRRLPARR